MFVSSALGRVNVLATMLGAYSHLVLQIFDMLPSKKSRARHHFLQSVNLLFRGEALSQTVIKALLHTTP